MKRCISTCLALAMAASGAALAVSPAAAQQGGKFGPKVTALIAEAQKEGRLQLSWSSGGFGGKDIPAWIDGFNKFYGLHLPYSFTPAPSMPQQAAAVLQAAQSGTQAPSDLFFVGPDNLLTDYNAHATRSYDWAELAKEVGVDLPAKAVATDNVAVAIASEVFGIVYNSQAISPKEVPQTLADTLDSKWKGRIATTPYAAGFNELAVFDPNWGPAKTETFVTKLAHQAAGLIRCGEPGPLLSGQFDMLVLDCDVAPSTVWRRGGMPIDFVVPKDAPITNLWYMAVPKTSPDPAAGALLALFMLTKEGQELSWKSDGNDLSLLPSSHTAAELPGTPAAIGTLEMFAAHPETLTYSKQYIKIVSALRK